MTAPTIVFGGAALVWVAFSVHAAKRREWRDAILLGLVAALMVYAAIGGR